MKNLFPILDDSEKKRILEMHQTATKNNYISESLKILLNEGSPKLQGQINDIKARVDVSTNYEIVKEGKARIIKITPKTVVITTSDIQIPNTEILFKITNNEMFITLMGFEFPLGKIDAFQQFNKIYQTFPLRLENRNLIFPGMAGGENDIPEESAKFINWMISQGPVVKGIKLLLGKILQDDKFKNIEVVRQNINTKITQNTNISIDIVLTHENTQITDMTKDNISFVSNVDIDITYNSNLPSNPDELTTAIAKDVASGINLPKF